MLEGLDRVRVKEFTETDNYLSASVEPIETVDRMTREIEALARRIESLFYDYVQLNPRVPNEVLLTVQSIEERSALVDVVAANLRIRNSFGAVVRTRLSGM